MCLGAIITYGLGVISCVTPSGLACEASSEAMFYKPSFSILSLVMKTGGGFGCVF